MLVLSVAAKGETNPSTFVEECENTNMNASDVVGFLQDLNSNINSGNLDKAMINGGILSNFFTNNPQMQKFSQYGDFLLHYGMVLSLTNQGKLALRYLNKSAEFWKEFDPEDPIPYMQSLLWIAETYIGMGDILSAKVYLSKVEESEIERGWETRYIIVKGSLLESEKKYKEALALFRKLENPHKSMQNRINNLRYLTGEAREVVAEMLDEYEHTERLTPQNIGRVTYLANLLEASDTTIFKSLEIGERIIDYYKKRNMERWPQFEVILRQQASRLKKAGRFEEAQEMMERAWNALNNFNKDNDRERMVLLEQFSDICFINGDYEQASVHALGNFVLTKRVLAVNLLRPEDRRSDYWRNKGKWYVSVFPKINMSYPYPLAVQAGYDALLIGKGMMNHSSHTFQRLANSIGGEAQENYQKYVDLNNLAKEEKELEKYSALIEERDRAFDRFALICKNHPEFKKSFSFHWKEVAQSLKEGESAVEFFEYKDNEGKSQYGAYFIADSASLPEIIHLCSGEELEKLSVKAPDARMWETVWGPLEEHIGKSQKVYFAPAGRLYLMPIEYSLAEDHEAEDVKYVRLTSTRNIIDRAHPVETPELMVLYGGLTYRMTPSGMQAEHSKYPGRRDLDISYVRQGSEKNIEPLPNTLAEVEEIAEIVKESVGGSPVLYTGRNGVEESFKALSGSSPEVVHFATHGFFFGNDYSNELPDMFDESVSQNSRDASMMRSGLLLAGSNRAFAEGETPEGVEDGILTALEISELDLTSTELAVLSACETGLGDVDGDGVVGLQSAFKQAGVDQLVISLWKVDDEATSTLMKEFYRQWMAEGKSKREALMAAQNAVRNSETHPEWSNPDYWAAFILLDEVE